MRTTGLLGGWFLVDRSRDAETIPPSEDRRSFVDRRPFPGQGRHRQGHRQVQLGRGERGADPEAAGEVRECVRAERGGLAHGGRESHHGRAGHLIRPTYNPVLLLNHTGV